MNFRIAKSGLVMLIKRTLPITAGIAVVFSGLKYVEYCVAKDIVDFHFDGDWKKAYEKINREYREGWDRVAMKEIIRGHYDGKF